MARKINSETRYRIPVFLIIVIVGTGLIGYRLFSLTVVHHQTYKQTARSQYLNPSALLAGRGTMYFSDAVTGKREIFSTNLDALYVYSNNRNVDMSFKELEALATLLELEVETLSTMLDQDTNYQVLAREVDEQQRDAINKLELNGITVASEVVRHYPYDNAGAHVAGFVGFDGKHRVGQYGLEAYYDDTLTGKTASLRGDDVVLTLDGTIEAFIEIKLDELIEQWNATGGTIIVQDPRTGALLGMASQPAFDPNHYWEYELDAFINPAVQQIFEPGSSFKAITMAAALDSKAVAPDTTYYDEGSVTIGDHTLSNFDGKGRGIQTMREVLQRSLNTGTIFAQQRMDNDSFLNYIVGFGFGEKLGIDVPGELEGSINNLFSNRRVNFATASFGQGIAATPLQMVNAYSTIANGGRRMRPYFVKEIIHQDGSKTVTQPKIVDAPIKDTTAAQLTAMLVDVVDKSYKRVNVDGYAVAGKTGTAQIAAPGGGYLEHDVIHNFAGFAPAYDPRFTIFIKLDKPREVEYAVTSISPTFGEITRFLLNHYAIVPQQ